MDPVERCSFAAWSKMATEVTETAWWSILNERQEQFKLEHASVELKKGDRMQQKRSDSK